MPTSIYHGDIVYAKDPDHLAVEEGGYLVVREGFVEGIGAVLPAQ